jgi:hypothetical protein
MDAETIKLKERIEELERENSLLRQQHIEVTVAKELYLKIFEEFPALIWRSRRTNCATISTKPGLSLPAAPWNRNSAMGGPRAFIPTILTFVCKLMLLHLTKESLF